MAGTLSEQKLARSVAHRLKYYIDVRRREESFDSSGVIRDEGENLHLQPACLTKQKRMKEHDLAKIKLETYLRAYMGNVEVCTRKILKNPEKQKDLEKSIKKMAQDYLPDRKYERNMTGMKRQKTLQKTTFHLRVAAVPSMSPEELQRLVSSASKLIVAATSEISLEEQATEGVSSPRRSKTKSIQSLYNPYKDEAKRAKQERKNAESKKRIIDASNISSNSAKSKTFPLQTEPTGRSSGNAFYLPSGEGTVKKSILKSRLPPSRSSLTISEHQDKQPNIVQVRFPLTWQNASGRSQRPLKIKWGKSSHRVAKMVSSESDRSSKCLDARQPFLSFKNNPGAKRNDTKPMAAVSGLIVLNEQATQMHDQDHLKSKQAEEPQKNRPQKDEPSTQDLVSKITPECHPIHLKNFVGGIADEDQDGSDNCSPYHLRGEDATWEPASVSKPRSLMTCASTPVAKHGSCFLYEICQEMDQEPPSDLMTNGPMTTDENVVNQTAHCLLTPPFSLNDPEEQTTVEDSTRHLGIIPGKASDWEDICGPPGTSDCCGCLELLMDCVHESAKDQNSAGCPFTATALSERSGSEQSEEEFTTSSASSSLSATSLINLREQMNGNATDENADIGTKAIPELLKPENLRPENQTTWLKAGSNDNERQRSSGEKRRAMHYRTADTGANQIVYFSQFPISF